MQWGICWFDLLVKAEKNQVTYHLLLAHHQCSNHLLLTAMLRQGALKWRYYTFTQNENAIAKVQAHVAYHASGCSIIEVCQKGINHIYFIK